MKTTKHRFGYEYKSRYENLERISTSEGCVVYKGFLDGKSFVVVDCGTLADFLEDEPNMLNELITIYEFDSEMEADSFIKSRGKNV